MILIYIILICVPTFFWIRFFRNKCKIDAQPVRFGVKLFLLGMGLGLIVLLVETPFPANNIWEVLLLYLIVAPVIEEISKFLLFRTLVYNSENFTEPVQGLFCAVLIGLGFGTFESLGYAVTGSMTIMGCLLRGFAVVPIHAIATAISAHALGTQKFPEGVAHESTFKGLAKAILLHSLLNISSFVIAIIGPVLAAVIGYNMFTRRLEQAMQQRYEQILTQNSTVSE